MYATEGWYQVRYLSQNSQSIARLLKKRTKKHRRLFSSFGLTEHVDPQLGMRLLVEFNRPVVRIVWHHSAEMTEAKDYQVEADRVVEDSTVYSINSGISAN